MHIAHYRRTPPFHVLTQVADMTAAYVSDLCLVPVPPSNHLWPLYSYALKTELEIYMDRMGSANLSTTGLIVAEDPALPGKVTGYILHMPVVGAPDASGLAYIAVDAAYRRRGVARLMVEHLLNEFPHVELSCPVDKVAMYERLGFKVIGVRDNQVRLNTRDYTADGRIGTIDVAPIFNSPEASMIRHQQLQKYGRKAMDGAAKAVQRLYDQGVFKAKQLVAQRGIVPEDTAAI
ncbi:GNAT family N-acetyltransferase [Pseudomonas sp. NCHU5208]|uniref:GNAT family N-acetyltransferase n=1 Tax=unclassified Pseudomonas TaxID=196821 RepID=UPI003F9ADD49